jgi:hypothetical protein
MKNVEMTVQGNILTIKVDQGVRAVLAGQDGGQCKCPRPGGGEGRVERLQEAVGLNPSHSRRAPVGERTRMAGRHLVSAFPRSISGPQR